MLSMERKHQLEEGFYMSEDEDIPVGLDDEEREYWYELEHQWNQTLNSIYGAITQADKRERR